MDVRYARLSGLRRLPLVRLLGARSGHFHRNWGVAVPEFQGVTGAGYSTSDRLAADSLPRSRAISYLTFCPSLSELRPARSTALIWTNTSLPPSLGSMNPKPF